MAHTDSYSMLAMLDALQRLRFAAGKEPLEEDNPVVPPPGLTPPRETIIMMEKNEQGEEAMEEVEEDWIGDLMDKYATKGLEAVLNMINTKDQQHPPISAPAFSHESCLELDEDASNWMDQD